MAYATVSELEDYTGSTLDANRASLLLVLASAAVDNIAASIGGTLAQVANDTRTLDAAGTTQLMLPRWPVTAVSEVKVIDKDGDEETLDTPEDSDPADPEFRWSRTGMLTRVGNNWPDRPRSVVVTFTHGFAEVPDEVKLVTLQAASRAVLNPARLNSFSDGQVSVGFGGGGVGTQVVDLLKDEQDIVLRAIR